MQSPGNGARRRSRSRALVLRIPPPLFSSRLLVLVSCLLLLFPCPSSPFPLIHIESNPSSSSPPIITHHHHYLFLLFLLFLFLLLLLLFLFLLLLLPFLFLLFLLLTPQLPSSCSSSSSFSSSSSSSSSSSFSPSSSSSSSSFSPSSSCSSSSFSSSSSSSSSSCSSSSLLSFPPPAVYSNQRSAAPLSFSFACCFVGPAAVALRGVAYFAGGMGRKGESSAIDIYDSATSKWSKAQLSMPRKFLAACSIDTGASHHRHPRPVLLMLPSPSFVPPSALHSVMAIRWRRC